MNIENIQKVLLECYSKVQDEWNDNNKCFGICAITSLIINDYFGGDICKIHVDGISHYFNSVEDKIIDLTSSQFNHEIEYKNYQIIDRDKILPIYHPSPISPQSYKGNVPIFEKLKLTNDF